MKIESCTKADFDWILNHFDDFWDHDETRERHHPIFFYELGNTAFVIRDGEAIAAYLFAFIATASPTGYVHMVAVNRRHRRKHLAWDLYEHFIGIARVRGCLRLKATCAPTNEDSIAFHRALDMRMETIKNYAGPGIDRIVFLKEI